MDPDRTLKNTGGVTWSIESPRVIQMLRLANHLHRLPHDPALRKHELLDGLMAMAAADAGACAVLHDEGGPAPAILSLVMKRAPRRFAGSSFEKKDPLVVSLAAAVRREARRGREPALFSDIEITSVVRLDRRGTYGGVVITRFKPFSESDRVILETLHSEMAWIYELDLPLASPDVVILSPRARQTLQYLLAGLSEKEIAACLKLSHNTVHHYVKQLYRHFAVSTRSQLLARWMRQGVGSKPR